MRFCRVVGCNKIAAEISRKGYCAEHLNAARIAWKSKIAESANASAERNAKWADLHKRAHEAGMNAGNAHTPVPMIVQEHANPLDDNSPVIRQYAPVMGGVCGFAWINITPGNSSFARWLSKNKHAHKSYYGGVDVWVGEFGQSMEKKQAYARAYAEIVSKAGITAWPMSRMD